VPLLDVVFKELRDSAVLLNDGLIPTSTQGRGVGEDVSDGVASTIGRRQVTHWGRAL